MKRSKATEFGKPDKENPEWTKEDFARARSLGDFPDMQRAVKHALRGRPAGRTKQAVTLSLDSDVVASLRGSGKGWQTRVNDLLRVAAGLLV